MNETIKQIYLTAEYYNLLIGNYQVKQLELITFPFYIHTILPSFSSFELAANKTSITITHIFDVRTVL